MITDFRDAKFWLRNMYDAAQKIDVFISEIKTLDRATVSTNVLLCARTFVEYVSNFVAISDGATYKKVDTRQAVNDTSLNYIQSRSDKYDEICRLYQLTLKSTGHEIVSFGDYAERLMQAFMSYLVRIRHMLYSKYGISILKNISLYPLDMDQMSHDYYRAIEKTLCAVEKETPVGYRDVYYISKKRIVHFDNSMLYEYTISIANDSYDKADRMIAFSHIDIYDNYAVELQTQEREIEVKGIKTKIDFIVNYDVNIRNCEFDKIARILIINIGKYTKNKEYERLMEYIKENKLSLGEIVQLSGKDYSSFKRIVFDSSCETNTQKILNKARQMCTKKAFGYLTMLYLLATMNNEMLDSQIPFDELYRLADSPLYLSSRVLPFEKAPYCANLPNASCSINILLKIIPIEEHICELVKREIDNYSKAEDLMYCPIELFKNQQNLQVLIQQYNNRIGQYRESIIEYRCDDKGKQYLCVVKNEDDTKVIFSHILEYLTTETINQYPNYVKGKIVNNGITFDDIKKEEAVVKMFDGRSIFAVYGPAGTGKSFLAKKVIEILDTYAPLCLTTTYAAKDNLKRKIGAKKASFDVIEKVIKSDPSRYAKYSLLILDECSTISNSDMAKLLGKIQPKLILLLGDIYQIESIQLGNWFRLYKRLIKGSHYIELDKCFRTNSEGPLKKFWDLVRDKKQEIPTFMANYRITHPIQEFPFDDYSSEDTITLCLNYGGLFGINNVNKIMQLNNPSNQFVIRKHVYKKGDPIIFRESRYYKNVFYNNLKGIIKDIERTDNGHLFTVEVFDTLDKNYDASIKTKQIEYLPNGHTKVVFLVAKSSRSDYDNEIKQSCVVPFNVGYAISIHKAQGLEFNKVRLIATKETEDLINHNIFYTAITRAVENVDIYWSPETENNIINSFSDKRLEDDFGMLHKYVISFIMKHKK